MSAHPYRAQPAQAFWARSVATNFAATALLASKAPLIRHGDAIVSAGSCFASNLVPFLETAGFSYLRTEPMHPAFAAALAERDAPPTPQKASLLRRWRRHAPPVAPPAADNFGYAQFSAAYGNIYTVRQLLQLLRRATGRFAPAEHAWDGDSEVIDPYRPGLRYKARTHDEFEALTRQHLARTRDAFARADVFVLTLGLTEAWISRADGAVFPACPGTIAGTFDASRHAFHNFALAEIAADLDAFVDELRDLNPKVRLILTVSPVPLVATATQDHVLCASTYSKSVLRVAAEETARKHRDVTYFPAYEIVTGPQAPQTYLARDRRNVTPEAVATVMAVLLDHCEKTDMHARPAGTPAARPQDLSAAFLDAECEEVASAHAFARSSSTNGLDG